jgi:hypothetical protein
LTLDENYAARRDGLDAFERNWTHDPLGRRLRSYVSSQPLTRTERAPTPQIANLSENPAFSVSSHMSSCTSRAHTDDMIHGTSSVVASLLTRLPEPRPPCLSPSTSRSPAHRMINRHDFRDRAVTANTPASRSGGPALRPLGQGIRKVSLTRFEAGQSYLPCEPSPHMILQRSGILCASSLPDCPFLLSWQSCRSIAAAGWHRTLVSVGGRVPDVVG